MSARGRDVASALSTDAPAPMQGLPYLRLDSALPDPDGWAGSLSAARRVLRCQADGQAALEHDGAVVHRWADPIAALDWLGREAGAGRWIGFFSYDLGRYFERLPSQARDEPRLPLFAFAHQERLQPAPPIASRPFQPADERPADLQSDFTRADYEKAVQRVKEFVAAGDVFQANLSQRFTARTTSSASAIYERLQAAAPARYGALLDFGDFALVSSSPELFLRVQPRGGRRQIITRPIKGTRPRGPGMFEALRDSAKDQAELDMIVDLERNDLGRVCRIGSVHVTERRRIEAHPTVYHGAATIEGELRDDVGLVDLLRATFPSGSVTGAPKIRAMEIIDELEPTRRGAYCGAIGWIAGDGAMQFNVAIRTIVLKAGVAHVCVGGGIVADSDPAAEYEETLVKARAMFAALGVDRVRPR